MSDGQLAGATGLDAMRMTKDISRRAMITAALGATGSLLVGCNSSRLIDTSTTGSISTASRRPAIGVDANLRSSARMYAEMNDGEYTLAAIPYEEMEGRFRR